MKRTVLIFGINIFSLFTVTGQEQWSAKTSMSIPRNASCAVELNDTIYVFGGGTDNGIIADVECYSPVSDTWNIVASMTFARAEMGAAVVNGKIYVIGGYDGNVAVNTVEEYNPATNIWSTKSPMPTARSLFSLAVFNNKIYVIGGWPGNMDVLEIYDPVLDTWTNGTSMPVGRHNINSCVAVNDSLYFIGGKNDLYTIFYDQCDVYEPISDSWFVKASLPAQNFSGAATVLNNRIHYLGGTSQPVNAGAQYNTHLIYDPLINSWSNALSLPSNRARHVSVTWQDKIFVIGGHDEFGNNLNSVEVYEICSVNNSVTQNGLTLSADHPGGSYQWLDCNDNYYAIPGENNQLFTPTMNGSYAVRIEEGNCVDTSACLLVTSVGISETINSPLKVFPNPSSGFLNIKLPDSGDLTGGEIIIYDNAGREIVRQEIINSPDVKINVPGLAPGRYLLKFILKDHVKCQGVIIQ